jgi:hypothetical protein
VNHGERYNECFTAQRPYVRTQRLRKEGFRREKEPSLSFLD